MLRCGMIKQTTAGIYSWLPLGFKVLKKIEIKDGPKYISIEPFKNDLIIDFEIVYTNPLIRTRRKVFKFSNTDFSSIYNSRTFCLYEDIDYIKSQGLAKGGS